MIPRAGGHVAVKCDSVIANSFPSSGFLVLLSLDSDLIPPTLVACNAVMMKFILGLLVAMTTSSAATATAVGAGCDVTQHGAKGDNHTEATGAFAAAIAACQGRGAVTVPPGTYLIRPVELLSHTTLIIEPGAMLVAWAGVGWPGEWPNSTTRTCSASPYEAKNPVTLPERESLLHGDAVENVTVTGGGTIDGQGWRWWPLRDQSEYWHHCRPHLIRIHGTGGADDLASQNVRFSNVTLHNSPRFNFHVHARRARFTHMTIVADGCPYNTDGFNVGGDDVYIADSTVHNGDDCVPIGKNTSNVLVERVTCTGCGSEHGGGVSPIIWNSPHPGTYIRNLTFRNITFSRTAMVANIKSLPSYEGTVEGVVFEDFVLDRVGEAIQINPYGQHAQLGAARGLESIHVANVSFRNIRGTAAVAGTFNCAKGQCVGIELQDVQLTGTVSNYSCKGSVVGTAKDCSPKPCF